MPDRHMSLAALGWDDWFEEQLGLQATPCDTVARVAAVDRDQLLLLNEGGPFRGKLSGSYMYRNHRSLDLPCVGDWVCVDRHREQEMGLVQALLERRTILRRRAAGEAVGYQMIAANVDRVIIVQSCHYDFNVKRMERYLVMAVDGGAEPCILLTKTDLVPPDHLASQLAEIRGAGITAPVLTLSNVTREGVSDLQRMLVPGKTYCFVGSSGVGKSTIINGLIGRAALGTSGVSATGEGRHTTTRRELIALENGALVIDNPGMREFGILGAESGLEGGFPDIAELSRHCRYRDCRHGNEPGCAVLRALETGDMDRKHYENYMKLRAESDFHEMTYVEKRNKDREFGKFIKSVKKNMPRD